MEIDRLQLVTATSNNAFLLVIFTSFFVIPARREGGELQSKIGHPGVSRNLIKPVSLLFARVKVTKSFRGPCLRSGSDSL
ncbi:hypothetical protein C0583_04405 [Candidatus Parcubacteria bacterium]|nr:MAG: hypothetical protein C0583_04405 [Candidatus Parcubacteria bacterium]